MKHRKLRLDQLTVESFETSRDPRLRGTVYAHGPTDACSAFCSENGDTCDYNCTASFREQRVCVGSETCPGECGGGGFTDGC